MGIFNASVDYPWLITLDEMIVLCMDHLEEVRQSSDMFHVGLHLKMASTVMRHALALYIAKGEGQ
jgi:hypothetical protein